MNKLSSLVAISLVAACGGKPAPAPEAPRPPEPVADPKPAPAEKPMNEPTVTQTAAPQDLQFPNEEFRAHQPEASAPHAFHLPKVKTFTLKNGIEVFLVEHHELPIVSMDLSFDGGGRADPKGKDGLAGVCMQMLTEGTDKLDKIQYSEALADTASSISAYATDDAHGLQLSSLTKHLDSTFALFVDTLRTPGMRASDFDRMVKRRIEGVKQARGNPGSVAGRVTGVVLYGPTHPFGGVTTEDGLKSFTLDECKTYVSTWLKPKHAKLFIVGDLDEASVRKHFESGPIAAWTGTNPKLAPLPAPKTMKGRIFFVNIPGAAQSQVALMQFGPKRNAPDYFPTSMLSSVFGGGFSSRINMNLREDKGYAYGARGGFGYSRDYGTFTAQGGVQANATYQTIVEIDREVKELATNKKPVDKEELDREKTGAILALPGRFATGQAALGQYRSLVYYGLPLDYYDTFTDKVAKVTEVQVKAAAAHIKPNEAIYLVVGDGDANMIVHDEHAKKDDPADKKDPPMMKDGKQVTLREALTDLAQRGDVGAGGLVELDPDGKPVK